MPNRSVDTKRSDAKAGPALELGADEAVLSSDTKQMGVQRGRLDLIVDTASGKHDPSPYLRALRRDGTLVMLRLPERYEPEAMALLGRNLTVSGSGGTNRTREMLAFCAEHGIVADVEVLPIAEVRAALDRLSRNDVRWLRAGRGSLDVMTTATTLGIRDVSELTGLSIDTLRWYEKEGLLPVVGRSSDGRRSYTPAAVGFVRLVQALRRTGMPVAEVRAFVQIGAGTVATHPVRLALLEQQAEAVQRRIVELQEDLLVMHRKIDNYRDLIARGVDCEDEMG